MQRIELEHIHPVLNLLFHLFSAIGICVTHQGTIGDERDGRFDTMIENVNFGRSKIKSDQRCSEYDKGIQRL